MSKPKLAAEITKQLRRFHQVEIPGSKGPQLWKDILKFFQTASTLMFDDSEKQTKYETISFDEVYAEVVELKELTGRLNAPVVFAHNDLLSGNQMHNEEEVSDKDLVALYIETNTYMLASHLYWALIQAKMSLIDYEYLGYFFLRSDEYKKQKEKCFSLAQSYLSRSHTG
ncbi:Ethanolamine kinase [Actinidia chinensis var. chinensis]|uniref:ethanolamine kinase n=1 Tax=Actinidia chinensis var. chinensis TaxID=1590841 RepID=A0A2R6S1W1_ACTCC|nr:Ethanolamine kinase [Actinidia chinensis var. chinensis]